MVTEVRRESDPADHGPASLVLTVGDLLRQAAAETPTLLALVEGIEATPARKEWTYAELLRDAEAAARAVLETCAPGDRVAIWSDNVPEWVVVQMGAALAGVALITLNPALREAEMRHIMRDSGATLVFTVGTYRGYDMIAALESSRAELPRLRRVVTFDEWPEFLAGAPAGTPLPAVAPQEVAQILYTSGTTGSPKGVELRHGAIVRNARDIFASVPVPVGASMVVAAPQFHVVGSIIHTLGALHARARIVLLRAFDPGLQLRLIESESSVLFCGVPTMLHALIEHPDLSTTDLSSVRFIMSGGATCDPALVRHLEDSLGVPMSIVYGQTESSAAISMTHLDDSREDRATSVGRAMPGTEIKIAATDDRTTPVGPGVIGEICTRGYHVMAGYLGAPTEDATIDADGWLHTGDLGSLDEHGLLRIEGRLKDMIIRGGENIYPREIEDVLQDHDAVAEVAVVGIADAFWGEQVAAFVRLKTGAAATHEELQDYCTSRLARHKVPKIWNFVDSFPMTGSGKIYKPALRRSAAS